VGSKLVIVSVTDRIQEQLEITGITEVIGDDNIYVGDDRVGAAVNRAYADATAWVKTHRSADGHDEA